MNLTLTKADLMEKLEYSDYQAKDIIHRAKKYLIAEGYTYYDNPRLGRVPRRAVEQIIGFEINFDDNGDD